jgi:hypothetical protein
MPQFKTKIRLTAALAASAMAIAAAAPASAAVITRTFNFSASNFSGSGSAPISPVVGSFTVTFDDAVFVGQQTSGITVNSLNMVVGSTVGYGYFTPSGTMHIGGISAGVSGVFSGSDDFLLVLGGAQTASPTFAALTYTSSAFPGAAFLSTTGSLVETPAVPEPATWATMLAGFGLLGASMRRRSAAPRVRAIAYNPLL